MNAVRFGLSIRALRRRKGWRQLDLARRAGTSQQTVSRMERGDAETATLASIHRVAAALEAQIDLAVRWRGGLLDRVLDERHARLVGSIAGRLATWGFDVVPEVSYAEYGERGSIDLLAVDRGSRLLVVVEAKTELTSIEATLRKHDEKVRLAPVVAQRRLGLGGPWRAIPVLVLPESGGA
ncbi:MAG TPA: helix-turn-helix transcriptional regulator, partial [Candidatus Limnocylindrales bacterium]|nr:helix-turn-helix transcriptional regulator [Candidatus Limnocylindrales bacterium]